MTPRHRYQQAHEEFSRREYPLAYAAGHYSPPIYPKTQTANGLTQFIMKFLNWSGHRATRINVSGRLIEGPEKQASGTVLTIKKWLPSSTRKGTADISATIRGRSVMIEIKIGKDRPSEAQLKEQERERRSGGIYEFIHSVEEFFILYDSLMNIKV